MLPSSCAMRSPTLRSGRGIWLLFFIIFYHGTFCKKLSFSSAFPEYCHSPLDVQASDARGLAPTPEFTPINVRSLGHVIQLRRHLKTLLTFLNSPAYSSIWAKISEDLCAIDVFIKCYYYYTHRESPPSAGSFLFDKRLNAPNAICLITDPERRRCYQ